MQLFVGSIKEEMSEDHLREYFSQFGSVALVDITKIAIRANDEASASSHLMIMILSTKSSVSC